jgi:hypothetical protein
MGGLPGKDVFNLNSPLRPRPKGQGYREQSGPGVQGSSEGIEAADRLICEIKP